MVTRVQHCKRWCNNNFIHWKRRWKWWCTKRKSIENNVRQLERYSVIIACYHSGSSNVGIGCNIYICCSTISTTIASIRAWASTTTSISFDLGHWHNPKTHITWITDLLCIFEALCICLPLLPLSLVSESKSSLQPNEKVRRQWLKLNFRPT